ncbi:hypothetical protein NIES25_64000 (plasmid) [Nostoc linckia NIES-25]|nr:hypothetical protein NIES25_64000 [Nostoc linckia NIES-25]
MSATSHFVPTPDLSWLKRDIWDNFTQEPKEKFAPVCPDFVLELRSDSDCLQRLQNKMGEYRDNGAKLACLIDLKAHKVEIYRPNQQVEVLESPASLLGEYVLPGFILNLEAIW